MSDQLAAVSAATGVPEELIQRAAAARGQAAGVSTEEILAAWAGGESPVAPAPATEDVADQGPEVQADADAEADTTPIPAPEPVPAVAPAVAPKAAAAIEVPESVGIDDAVEWPVVTSVSSAGLKERTRSVIPRWLMSVFVIVPFFALGYLLVFTGGTDCGNAGQLSVDRFGQVVNCDGTPFEGKAVAAAGFVDYFALGAEVYGRTGSCAGCHGADGGGGAGPAFSGGAVTAAFSICEEHVTWVRLGTQAWGAEVGSTYGDLAKAVGGGGVMPGFSQLSDEELRSVVLYERVRWGGEDEAISIETCGLGAPAEDSEMDMDMDMDPEMDMDPTEGEADGIEASAGSGS